MLELFTVENSRIYWNPHQFQMQMYDSRARFTFVPKGWRGGFSSWIPKVLETEMKRCGPGNKNLAYFAIAPTLQVAKKPGSILPAIETVFCTHMGYATYNQNTHTFTITPEGERALWGHAQKERTQIVGCYAEDPQSFASATFLAGVADEVGQTKFKREAWNTLRARMATMVERPAANNPPHLKGMGCGRVWAGSTVYTLNWFVDFYEQWKKHKLAAREELMEQMRREPDRHKREAMWKNHRAKEYYGLIHPEMHFIRFDSTGNPAFSKAEMAHNRRTLPAWFFDMRFRALPRKPAGTIYEAFDGAKHVVPNREIPADWPRLGIVDFGKRNFYATVWAQNPETEEAFLYAAYHRADLSTTEHGAELLRLFPEVDEWVAGQVSEDDDRAQLAAGGLSSRPPAFRGLWLGINNLAAAIKLDKVWIFEDLRPSKDQEMVNYRQEIVDQLKLYSRPIDTDTGAVRLDEDPVDKDKMHWCDCCRYAGTVWFAGLSEGQTILAASRKGGEMSGDNGIAVRSRAEQPIRGENRLSDIAAIAGGEMNRFASERYGDVYDPLF